LVLPSASGLGYSNRVHKPVTKCSSGGKEARSVHDVKRAQPGSTGEDIVRGQGIPWARPTLSGSEEPLVLDALRSSWISGGPYVDRLEQEVADRMGIGHAVAVSNGTTALELALRALHLERGAEVIVPGFTFVAAANMVLSLGLTPLYADVKPDTWLLDPAEIHRLGTARTKAVIPVHLYGNVADMDAIGAAASERGLDVVEDAAEAAFSRQRGRCAGTFGRLGTFSFHATKTITTGEGGMVVTADDALAARCRTLRDHGMRKDKRYWHDVVGFNFRLTNLQAAIGCGQLQALDRILAERRAIHDGYKARLSGVNRIKLQAFDQQVNPVVWVTVVQLEDAHDLDVVRARRDRIMAGMADDGVETRPGFYDLSLLPPYGCPPLPVARRVSASTIALPTFVGLRPADLDRICDSLRNQLCRHG
jgi:perosamine synthetase